MTGCKLVLNRLRTEFSTQDISCSLFSKCSGCKLQKNVRTPPIWDKLVDFFFKKGVSVEFVSKEIVEYRSKIKLAVRGSSRDPQIGLFMEGTHKVIDIPFCPLHYPVMNEACALIKKKIIQHGIVPYEEETVSGFLRYIQIFTNVKTNKLQLSLMLNSFCLSENESKFIDDIYKSDDFWHSIWVSFLPGATNTILGNNWKLLHGEEEFWQEILGIKFYFHPSCFSQVHISIFEEMLQYIAFLVPEAGSVLELYAGVGCIGVYLAQKSSKVVLVESCSKSERCFKKTASELSEEISKKCTFYSSSVEDMVFPTEKIDVLIVDPPRKGLSKKCKEKIYILQPTQLIYVSCGPDSFIRDCEELLQNGWILNQARGFLLFPGTDHAEIVASFRSSSFSSNS